MLFLSTSCKQLNKWFGKSSMSKKDISLLLFEKQELEKRIRKDSANYVREMEALRLEYEQKLAEFEKVNKKQATGFSVVVGSFKNIGLAEKYAKKIQSMGYEGNLIQGPNNFNCITTGTFANLKEALPVLSTARSGITPEAWVFIK